MNSILPDHQIGWFPAPMHAMLDGDVLRTGVPILDDDPSLTPEGWVLPVRGDSEPFVSS